MYTLEYGQTIAGVASNASKVTYTLGGMELTGTAENYRTLAQGQLAASAATIYTAPASAYALVRGVEIVNTDTSASQTFQLFIGGTTQAKAITPVITLPASSGATYGEHGWKTYNSAGAEQVTAAQIGGSFLNDVHIGYSEFADISNPSAPSDGYVRFYGKKVSGRMLPKYMPPSGADNPLQPALFGNNIVTYMPSSSTNGGTATLGGLGISWTAGGTVSHPTPSAGIVNQIHRTRYANVVTTTNQTLGIMATASGLPQFWRGNASGLGGFFFAVRYIVELWAANTCRIFVGLSDSTTAQVTLDIASMTGKFAAFAHDTTDGANVLWFITRDGTTTHKTSIAGATIAAGQGFDFYIYAKPNDSTIYYRVDSINTGSTIVDTSETNNLPSSTAFMGPQIHMSNGTANTTATTVAPSIARVYIESDH